LQLLIDYFNGYLLADRPIGRIAPLEGELQEGLRAFRLIHIAEEGKTRWVADSKLDPMRVFVGATSREMETDHRREVFQTAQRFLEKISPILRRDPTTGLEEGKPNVN
jgi:hypothetical protein